MEDLGSKRPTVNRRKSRGGDSALLGLALVGSAYLLSCAIVSQGHPWVGWVALFPLFVSIRVHRAMGATCSGGLWGLSLFVFLSTAGHSAAAGPMSLALLTGVPAAFALLTSMLTARSGFSPLVVGVTWAFVELALTPLGFHAGLLGATQADSAVLDMVGNSLGYMMVGFLAAFVGALFVTVVEMVRIPVGAHRPSRRAADAATILYSQILACISRLATEPCQPRAPPRPFALEI